MLLDLFNITMLLIAAFLSVMTMIRLRDRAHQSASNGDSLAKYDRQFMVVIIITAIACVLGALFVAWQH
jgi:amino acid transporter